MTFSTACGTPLSNFEAGLNYKDVRDPAVVVQFPLLEDLEISFIAWTTTPWTLPSNTALCVKEDMKYVKILDIKSKKNFILAKSRICHLYPQMTKKSGNLPWPRSCTPFWIPTPVQTWWGKSTNRSLSFSKMRHTISWVTQEYHK